MKKMILGVAIASVCAVAVRAEETKSEGLNGLFGISFGKVMGANDKCATNNVGELAYEYAPAKMFKGYTDYVLFATPLTRQVSQVRALALVSYDEAEEEMNSTIRVLEMKFNRKARSLDDNTKVIVFDNNDYIAVVKNGRRLTIDACCNRLRDLTKEEVVKAEKDRYAGDISVLALLPGKEDGDDRIYKIDSVFGVKLGEPFNDNIAEKKNDSGAWVHKFKPSKRFMGCDDYLAFATEKTKKVFMIRAVYCGNQYDARRDQMRRVIEAVTGRKMRSVDENDDSKGLNIHFGDYVITLEKNVILDRVVLDVVKLSLYQLQEKEHKEIERKAASADMDAL